MVCHTCVFRLTELMDVEYRAVLDGADYPTGGELDSTWCTRCARHRSESRCDDVEMVCEIAVPNTPPTPFKQEHCRRRVHGEQPGGGGVRRKSEAVDGGVEGGDEDAESGPYPSLPPSPAGEETETVDYREATHDGRDTNRDTEGRDRRRRARGERQRARQDEDAANGGYVSEDREAVGATRATQQQASGTRQAREENISRRAPTAETSEHQATFGERVWRACKKRPELIAMDIYWASGTWFTGHPSHNVELSDEDATELPNPVASQANGIAATGNIQQFLPKLPQELIAYRHTLEATISAAEDLDIWITKEGWRRGGPTGPLIDIATC